MRKAETRLGGGGKLSRTETVTVRLDPKLRYLAELASRLHRRTLSSYIEWAVKSSVEREAVGSPGVAEGAVARTIGSLAEELWDVDEADRFCRLAFAHPGLLTHEEQVRWKIVRECGAFWRGSFEPEDGRWRWFIELSQLRFDVVREHWDAVCTAAESGVEGSGLPEWQRTDPKRK